jgi:hypothetical protein
MQRKLVTLLYRCVVHNAEALPHVFDLVLILCTTCVRAGRAAQRLQEVVSSCGYDAAASTIHRLLGYRGRKTRASAAAAAAESSGSLKGAAAEAGAAGDPRRGRVRVLVHFRGCVCRPFSLLSVQSAFAP